MGIFEKSMLAAESRRSCAACRVQFLLLRWRVADFDVAGSGRLPAGHGMTAERGIYSARLLLAVGAR
jgi:hypothetical protein